MACKGATPGQRRVFALRQAWVLTIAPLIFCPPLMSCIRFCKKDCKVGALAAAAVWPCELFIAVTRFWKLELSALSGSVALDVVPVELL